MDSLKGRDELFDNLKGFLIFTVILGHAYEFYIAWAKEPTVMDTLYFLFYTFHMPLFVFISGYFSKNFEKCKNEAFERFLLPFFLFNIVFYVYKFTLSPYDVSGDFLLTPLYTFWYLLCMYLWRTVAKDLKKVRFIIPLSFVFGLWVGTVTQYGAFVSMSRFFVFLPFFVLGMLTTPDTIEKIRKIKWPFALLGLALTTGLALFVYFKTNVNFYLIYAMSPYISMRLTLSDGIVGRAVLYGIALLFIFFLIAAFPRKKTFLSAAGKRSLPIFIFHSYLWEIIPIINPLPALLKRNTWQNTAFLTVFALVGIVIMSLPASQKLYDLITGTLSKIILKKDPNKTE